MAQIDHGESDEMSAKKELQAADFISWAFFQKYERGDSQFYELISGNVIVEEVIRRRLWFTISLTS